MSCGSPGTRKLLFLLVALVILASLELSAYKAGPLLYIKQLHSRQRLNDSIEDYLLFATFQAHLKSHHL